MIVIKTKANRNQTGVSAVEVAIASLMMLAMVAIGLDATIFIMGYARLDQTPRDACRAAAAQPKSATDPVYPSVTCAAALQAAQTQLSQHQSDGTFIKQPYLTGLTAPYFIYQDYGGYTPGPPTASQSPYVAVTCSEQVMLPIPINFFGFSSNNYVQTGNLLTFTRRYVFPIVKMKAYTPASS